MVDINNKMVHILSAFLSSGIPAPAEYSFVVHSFEGFLSHDFPDDRPDYDPCRGIGIDVGLHHGEIQKVGGVIEGNRHRGNFFYVPGDFIGVAGGPAQPGGIFLGVAFNIY